MVTDIFLKKISKEKQYMQKKKRFLVACLVDD
jgi:hypothetical protein